MVSERYIQKELPYAEKPRLPHPQITWVIPIMGDENSFQILMAQRIGSGGQMTFPGGKIEPGESPLDAAVRELKEETNLEIPQDELINASQNPQVMYLGGQVMQTHPYFMFQSEEAHILNMIPDKHNSWSWFTLRETSTLITTGKLPYVFGQWVEIALEAVFLSTHIPTQPILGHYHQNQTQDGLNRYVKRMWNL